jgi:nucleoside phosphorylase
VNDIRTPLVVRERVEESVAAICHFLLKEDDPDKRALLMRDYVWRSRQLAPEARTPLHERVLNSCLPRTYQDRPGDFVRAPTRDVANVDVMMVAVQPVELVAALAALGIPKKPSRRYRERDFFHTEIPSHAAGLASNPRTLSVALTAVGESQNLHTMSAVGEISEAYRPQLWVLVGMAAGLVGEVAKGDVCFPETVWFYEPGRQLLDTFEPRPELAYRGLVNRQLVRFDPLAPGLTERLDHALAELPARHRPDDLPTGFTPRVSVRKDAVATGEKLLRSPEVLAALHQVHQRIVLGDQESYGFALACRDVNWLIARGIADYGDEDKTDSWQYLATLMAAHCVLEFLEQDYIPPGTPVEP